MEPFVLFSIAGAVILLGFLGEWIFDKTSIPDPIWLMLFGVILSQFMPVADNPVFTEVGTLFTVFALIFILFDGTINTNLRDMLFGVTRGSSIALLSFILTVTVTTVVVWAVGFGLLNGLLLGVIVGDSAQTVIIPLFKKIKISKEAAAALTFESAFSDVLCIVGAVTIIKVMTLNNFAMMDVTKSIFYSFSVAIVVGILWGFMWLAIHKKIDQYTRSYLTAIAVLLLLYSFVEYIGASGALACLAFAIVLGNSKKIMEAFHKNEEESITPGAKFFYGEISFFVKSFFFVYLGMLLNLKEPILILFGVVITLLVYLVRPLAVKLSTRKLNLSENDIAYLEVLYPKGLSAAVLAQLPLQYGLPYAQMFSNVIISVITSSILLTIIMIFLAEKGIFFGFGRLFGLQRANKLTPLQPGGNPQTSDLKK